MRPLSAIVVAASLAVASPVSAQVIDLSTIKCKEFLDSGKDTIGLILMWLSGYYTKSDDPAVIDFNKMKDKGAKLGEFCAKNPTIGLITAAEPIMASD